MPEEPESEKSPDMRDRWQQIQALFARALERPPEERDAFLESVCGGDTDLHGEVASLLNVVTNPMLEGSAFDKVAGDMSPELALAMDGQRVGAYRIIRRLGAGGMGTVFLAERADGQFEQLVALKLVKRGMDTDAVVARFQAERQILARLEHPNIGRLLDGGVHTDGRPYFALEYVSGEPITEYCAAHDLSVGERLRLFEDVCRAVAYAHRNLVVHRDIKPSNILVREEEGGRATVKLLDFGIAKLLSGDEEDMLTRTGERVLTPAYAAPEQLRGEVVTTATDVFGLGVVLYELLTGTRPAGGYETGAAVPPPSTATADRRVRSDLDTIVLTALREEPERRYASAEGLLADLRAYRLDLPVSAQPESATYRLRKYIRRNRVSVTAAVAVVLIGATVLGFSAFRITAERDRAQLEAQKSAQVSAFLQSLFETSDPRASGGEEITARQMLDRGAERIDEELAEQPEVRSEMKHLMGEVYTTIGSYDEAEALLEETLRLRRGLPDARDVEIARTLIALGLVHERQGRYHDAFARQAEAVDILRSHASTSPLALANGLHALAFLQLRLGDFADAETLIREALAIKERINGADNPDYAYSLNILGDLLTFQERYDESEAVHLRALDMRTRHLGDAHLDVAFTLHNLGAMLRNAQRYAESEARYREALQVWRRHYGYDHLESANTMSQLAYVIGKQGRYAEADSIASAALNMILNTLGPDHPQVAAMYGRRGDVLAGAGRAQEAELAYRSAIDTQRRVLGDDHPTITRWQVRLAEILGARGAKAEARELLRLSQEQCLAGGPAAYSGCQNDIAAVQRGFSD